MSFLNLAGKRILVMGLANRKSVAWHVGQALKSEGAQVIYSVRSLIRAQAVKNFEQQASIYICDVEDQAQTLALAHSIGCDYGTLDGIVHSIAFANYSQGAQPLHQVNRADFLQATTISSFSLIEVARAFKPYLSHQASVVAISISSLTVTAESYGYMTSVKASLEGIVRGLAKSFSADTEVRFNTVNSGPLKTSASAGIPDYIKNYLYAQKMTLRKRAVLTQEVANAVLFLLSERSSGINGQGLVVNAGMDYNYFDHELVQAGMHTTPTPST